MCVAPVFSEARNAKLDNRKTQSHGQRLSGHVLCIHFSVHSGTLVKYFLVFLCFVIRRGRKLSPQYGNRTGIIFDTEANAVIRLCIDIYLLYGSVYKFWI